MNHNEPDYDANNPILRGSQPVNEPLYFTDAITREAIDFIERYQEQPFFLYVAYNAVHSPLQAAERYMAKFNHIEDIHRQIFAAMLSNMDVSIGAIMKKLKETGLDEETLVVFLSDNGGPTRELTSSNYPLKGGKGNYYEGGIRIPFILRWKEKLAGNQVFEDPVISLDLFPTIAGLAQNPTTQNNLDGINLIPYLIGDNVNYPERTLFWHFKNKMALRKGDWKIVRNQPQTDIELYNLARDSGEAINLAPDHPDKLKELIMIWNNFDEGLKEKNR